MYEIVVSLTRKYTYYIRRKNDLRFFMDERRYLGDELPASQNWDGMGERRDCHYVIKRQLGR